MSGAYCQFCGHRCFVYRVLKDGRGMHLATCVKGMEHDRKVCGEDHTTAVNPHDPEPAGPVTEADIEAALEGVTWADVEASAVPASPPLLGPRPLLDREAVRKAIEHHMPFSATGMHGAAIATRSVMELARPMPTREQIEAAVRKTIFAYFGTYERPVELITDDVNALLNGAES